LLIEFISLLLRQLTKTMGKGDKRSKRGKIHIGTYGRTRKRKAAKKAGAAAKKTTAKKSKKAAK
jgi:ribosomal small subunit protein bTHX